MIFYAPVMFQNVIARNVVSGLLVIAAAIGIAAFAEWSGPGFAAGFLVGIALYSSDETGHSGVSER